MKIVVFVLGCTLLSVPALAGETSSIPGVIVESTTGENVIVESTTPETVVARRAGVRTSGYSGAKPDVALPLSWYSIFTSLLQLLLR